MLLFAEYDLVSTSLIHAAVVQSSDIFDKTRMHSITTKKKTINKQPSVPFTILILTLPRDWIGIQLILVSCIQRSPFWLFTLIFRTSLLNASA